MAYKRTQASNANRGTWSSGTAYVFGDIVTYGSPASSYQAQGAFTGGSAPAIDNSNANWLLMAQAGATGSTGSTGSAGAAGTNAAANVATATYSSSQNPIPSPTAGTFKLEVTYLAAATGAITDKLCARQTSLDSVIVKNETSYNITLNPPTGGTFDNGQQASYLLSPGDTATFNADPASSTSWEIA